MRAVTYLRISDDRTGRAAGVTRQGEDCDHLADASGWPIVDRFVDNDVSASNGKPRPEYQRMLAAIRAGNVDAVIAWHPDRLYRRPADLEELIEITERQRVTIRTVRAGELDLSTPTGRMVARILGDVARHEIEHKTDRWQRSVIQNRRAGEWSNSRDRLFGYNRDGEINPDEAERLRWICAQLISGRSMLRVLQQLNDEGVLTTRGNTWATSVLRRLLLNPRIAGHATHKGEVVGRGTWEPILDDATWEAVKARLHPYRARPVRKAILLGRVYCWNPRENGKPCATRMVTGGRSRKTHSGSRIYECPRTPPYDTGCRGLTVAAEPLELYVETFAKAQLDDPRFVAQVEARRAEGGRVAAARSEVDALGARLAELESELATAGGRAASAIVAAIGVVERDLDAARARLAATFPAALPDITVGWPTNVETRAALIGLTLARVRILPNPPPGGGKFNPDRVRIDPPW
ncbi:MAG: recombinase family protein [Actinopolymorphaceae bacterium]